MVHKPYVASFRDSAQCRLYVHTVCSQTDDNKRVEMYKAMLIYILCIFVAILFDLGFSHFEYQHIASSIFRLFVGFIATDCSPKVKICTVCKC